MSMVFNIYCDESCHLENDRQKVMVLGAIWCPLEKTREIAIRLREIKTKHGMPSQFEAKWTKVSPSKKSLYLDLLDYFFDDDDLYFRALIVPDKDKLQHHAFPGQDHDSWYYKMYFDMLKVILRPDSRYRIYLDIKDSRGGRKIAKLHDVLCNNAYDFSHNVIERVQLVRSHEVEQIQIADLLIGAVSYLNRGLSENTAKLSLVRRMIKRSGYSLEKNNFVSGGEGEHLPLACSGDTLMSLQQDWLPPLVFFDDYHGDWEKYLTAIYKYFKEDFINTKPKFRGKQLGLKRHPVTSGKEATFWHMISEGKKRRRASARFTPV